MMLCKKNRRITSCSCTVAADTQTMLIQVPCKRWEILVWLPPTPNNDILCKIFKFYTILWTSLKGSITRALSCIYPACYSPSQSLPLREPNLQITTCLAVSLFCVNHIEQSVGPHIIANVYLHCEYSALCPFYFIFFNFFCFEED